MNLERLQRDFLATLLAATQPPDARVAVYHRSVRANRDGALAAAYPVVRRLVGDAFFAETAQRFADAHPSRAGDLHAYGAELAGFLATYPHARGLDYLPDVARLEWAVHESRLAAQDPAFDYAALGRVEANGLGGIRMRLRACVRLVASSHPILAIWEANQEGRDGTPARTEGSERVLVRRDPSNQVVPAALDGAEWTMVEGVSRGLSLAQVAAECDRKGIGLGPALARLASLDVLAGFERGAA